MPTRLVWAHSPDLRKCGIEGDAHPGPIFERDVIGKSGFTEEREHKNVFSVRSIGHARRCPTNAVGNTWAKQPCENRIDAS